MSLPCVSLSVFVKLSNAKNICPYNEWYAGETLRSDAEGTAVVVVVVEK